MTLLKEAFFSVSTSKFLFGEAIFPLGEAILLIEQAIFPVGTSKLLLGETTFPLAETLSTLA